MPFYSKSKSNNSATLTPLLQLYTFGGKDLNTINSSYASHLRDSICIVKGRVENDQTYDIIDQNYISSSSEQEVSATILDKIGAQKVKIPKYRVTDSENNEYHIEGLSFPPNRVEMTEDEKYMGQFCHINGIALSSTGSINAKY